MPQDPWEEEFLRHMEVIQEEVDTLPVHLSPGQVVYLVGQLQLALRCPGNGTASARFARGLIDGLLDRLDGYSPGFADLMRLGDDPMYDVQKGG